MTAYLDPDGTFDGVGFVLTPETGIIAGDFDHCISDAGEISPGVLDFLLRLDSYAEISPSGRSVRSLFGGEKRADQPRCKEPKLGYEFYQTGRFVSVTGNHIAGTPETINPAQEAWDAIYAEVFPPKPAPRHAVKHAQLSRHFTSVAREDHEVLQRMFAAKNGGKIRALFNGFIPAGKSHSEADLALCGHIAFYTNNPAQIERIFGLSALNRDKWLQRADYRAWTITKAIEG
jgi:putative DNA primase/helicase